MMSYRIKPIGDQLGCMFRERRACGNPRNHQLFDGASDASSRNHDVGTRRPARTNNADIETDIEI
jgi:hypothetical protein